MDAATATKSSRQHIQAFQTSVAVTRIGVADNVRYLGKEGMGHQRLDGEWPGITRRYVASKVALPTWSLGGPQVV